MRKFHWWALLPVALAGLALGVAGTQADSQGPPQQTNTETVQSSKPTIVSTKYIRPARVLHMRTRFAPWTQPTASQVHQIIAIEAAREGISTSGLTNRISCESGFDWRAVNGQYEGLGQFANETFYRGFGTIGSRLVHYVTTRTRVLRVMRVRIYSNGKVVRRPRWRVRQRVIHLHIGHLSPHPVRTDGWAQVRIMSEAIAGHSAVRSSEWQCSL